MKKKDVAKLSRKKLERLQEQIVDELEQYKEIDEKRDGRKRERENYQDWKQREKIPLIGRAYIGKVEEITIAHTSIKGNAGETYEFNVIGTPAMDSYFHNYWPNKLRKDVHNKIQKFTNELIEDAVNDIEVIYNFITYEHTYFNYPKSKIPKMKAELKKEQFAILDTFPIKELKKIYLYNGFSTDTDLLGKYLRHNLSDKELKKLGLIKMAREV